MFQIIYIDVMLRACITRVEIAWSQLVEKQSKGRRTAAKQILYILHLGILIQ